MFQPRITFTHTITSALETIENTRTLVNYIPMIPPWERELQRTALVNTVHYSTKVEGNALTRANVEKLLAGHRATGSQQDIQEVANLKRVMDFVYAISLDSSTAIDEAVIKQINTFLLRDVPGTLRIGEYITGQNYIQDSRSGERIFTPPVAWDVPHLMAEFAQWLNEGQLVLSPVLQAGVSHLVLVAIHPFWDGNGRTARALATLIMYRGGYTLKRLFSWEEYVGSDTEAYHQAIRASLGETYNDNIDQTPWLEYFCEAMASSLEKLRIGLDKQKRAWDESYREGGELGLSRNQIEAYAFALLFGKMTTSIYMNATGASRATAVRHLNELVRFGLLRRIGKGRTVSYLATPPTEYDTPEPETVATTGQGRQTT